jgi:hypothetical protein
LKLGISQNFFSGKMPINGLRIPIKKDDTTCGWYLWAGETVSKDVDYFQPLHVHHLIEKYPPVLPYLGLPQGWRFLIAGAYEDVWFDEETLKRYLEGND